MTENRPQVPNMTGNSTTVMTFCWTEQRSLGEGGLAKCQRKVAALVVLPKDEERTPVFP